MVYVVCTLHVILTSIGPRNRSVRRLIMLYKKNSTDQSKMGKSERFWNIFLPCYFVSYKYEIKYNLIIALSGGDLTVEPIGPVNVYSLCLVELYSPATK